MEHGHAHTGGTDARAGDRRRMAAALAINLVFLAVEAVGGLLSGSLALLADAGHMLTDVGALGLALFVAHVARRPATAQRTYGLQRAEVLGAFVNGAALVLLVEMILLETWRRAGRETHIDGPLMLGVAVAGLAANLGSAWILARGDRSNLNLRGAFLHMMADTLGSVGAIAAGVLVWAFGWTAADLAAGVAISVLILYSSVGLLRETTNILLQGTPEGTDYAEVLAALESLDFVEDVHDLHIWSLTADHPVLSAHVRLTTEHAGAADWEPYLEATRALLADRFGITHATLQVERAGQCQGDVCTL